MTDVNATKLRQIRALLELAEHPSTPDGERTQALETAMRMMALYGIERAHLAATGAVSDPIDATTIQAPEPYGLAKACLLNGIGGVFRCRVIRTPRKGTLTIVGAASDREQVVMLYTSLLVQSSTEASRVAGNNAGHTRSRRNTFLHSYVNRIEERLTALHRRVVDEVTLREPGTALVLVDRTALVDRKYRDLFPTTRRTAASYRTDGAAMAAGREAANRADLGITRVGQSRREIAG